MALFRRKTKSNIRIEIDNQSDGIHISIKHNNKLQPLPIRLTLSELKKIKNLDQLQLIEDLFMDGKMKPIHDGKYMVTYAEIYNMTTEEKAMLGLPEETTKVDIELDNESFVGSMTFNFIPKIHSSKYANLHQIGDRKGAIIELPTKETIMLEEEYYHFLEEVDRKPAYDDRDKIFPYIAKVKKQAKDLGIKVSEHIERENYEFIDEVAINIERTDKGIDFMPAYKHESLNEEELKAASESSTGYSKIGKKRIFIDKLSKAKAEKIQEVPSIKGEDIPKFVQNPIAFIPEELEYSLEDFSDRVKSLGIRVYKAQPFINAEKNDRGWFNYNTGFKIKDNEGNEIETNDETYFEALGEDSYKKIDDNTFIEIPEQANYFRELVTKAKKETNDDQQSQPNLSNYILEIFENFTHVEYNKPLAEQKEGLRKSQVFDSKPPKGFNAILKPFQTEGFKWMKTLRATGNGGLLADDMGLGKTIQVVAYLLYLKEQKKLTPTLIVLPKTLIENWFNELHKFAPSLTDNIYIHTGPNRLKDDGKITTYDIVLTTYHTLSRDQIILGKVDWEMVICDEAQAIKNPSTANSNAIKALKSKGRLALTGTPVENNLTELWSIVDFVQPGILGSLNSFRELYEDKLEDEDSYADIQSSIEEKIKYIYLRRTKAGELKGQLPQKIDQPIPVNIGKEQDKLYQDYIEKVNNKEINGLQAIQKLKMLCSHPGLVDDGFRNISAKRVPKLHKTIDLLKDIKRKNEKVIIFTEYLKMQTILKREILMSFNIEAAIINGSSNSRQSIVNEFNQKPGFNVLILSPKAAGTGLTITGANHVIHYTRWWNPAVENQATDRVYRIGQEKDVTVYYPIVEAKGDSRTVEQVIDDILVVKKKLAENVIVPSKGDSVEQEVLDQLKDAL